jgi:hypothetical protein
MRPFYVHKKATSARYILKYIVLQIPSLSFLGDVFWTLFNGFVLSIKFSVFFIPFVDGKSLVLFSIFI